MARVAIVGENSIEYVSKLLDVWNNGDCAVLLDWRIPSNTLIQMMEEAGVLNCIIEKVLFEKIQDPSHNINFDVYEKDSASSEILPSCIYDKYHENYSKDEAVIIYSSGTTGKAKGIILSHYAINTNADAVIDYMKPTTQDCMYIAKTISHSSTITGELLVALKSRMKLIIGPVIVPPRYVLNNVKKYGVTFLCVNPTLLSMYSDELNRRAYDISSLKTIYVSGSILTDYIYDKARRSFTNVAIYNVYGLSEAGPRVSAQKEDCCKNNSVGMPIKNVDVIIVNENGSIVKCGEKGIIHVKTPSLFSGYVSGNRDIKFLNGEYLNSGDIGYFDENNELHITDRVDDVIIIDSHKIYPSEVEKIIKLYTSINECVVVKVEQSFDCLACLYVCDSIIDKNVVIKNLRTVLLPFEIPKIFFKVDSLPYMYSGKISKHKAKECIEQCLFAEE